MRVVEQDIRQIYLISDTKLFPDAERFVAEFLKRNDPISSSQLNGLENILAASHSIEAVETYIKHQCEKAEKNANASRKDAYVANFYRSLQDYIDKLDAFVANQSHHFRGLADASASDEAKAYRTACVYALLQEFVQHLIADHNFRAQGY